MKLELWRCEQCKRILSETNYPPGLIVRLKCPHCDSWNNIRVPPDGMIGPRVGDYEKRSLG